MQDILGNAVRERRLERDIVSICILGEIEFNRGEHGRNGGPDGCIRNVST